MKAYYKLQNDGFGHQMIYQINVESDTAPDGYTEDIDSLRAILDVDHVPDAGEIQQMELMGRLANLQVANAQKDVTIIDMMAQIAQLQLGGTK